MSIEEKILKDKEYTQLVKDLLNNDMVIRMKEYKQHFEINCYEHSLNVSYLTYKCCRKFNLDYKSAARAALLHDLFLYDWRKRENGRKGFHAFTHPKTALENASKVTKLSKKEKDIILNHMWPVTIRLPKYLETYIVTFMDKYSATIEYKYSKQKVNTDGCKLYDNTIYKVFKSLNPIK